MARCPKALPGNPSDEAAQLTVEPWPKSTTPGLCFTSPKGPITRKEEAMYDEYVMSDLVEIGSATENILFNPAKEGPELDDPGQPISRPSNG